MRISGTVREVNEDKYAAYLIVDRDDTARPVTLAVRCWDKSCKGMALQTKPGTKVEVHGDCKSNQSKKDPSRWFTEFEASAINHQEDF